MTTVSIRPTVLPGLALTILLLAGAPLLAQRHVPLTAPPAERPVVLMDYHHHAQPQVEIGNLIVTGGWADNLGRYGLNDFHHTNGFDPLVEALEEAFALVDHREPLTADNLRGADIVFIFTPDSKNLNPDVALLSDQEIDDLEAFVADGGSLMLMVNSFHPTEKFDQEQMAKLFQRFGLSWNDDDTSYADIAIGDRHPWFHDIDQFHYGAGCTFNVSDEVDAEVLLHVGGDVGYEDVEGPGIVLVRHGEGKVIAVGDTGSWGANLSRPWTDNKRFLQQLFAHAKRDQGVPAPTYAEGEALEYEMTMADVRVIPTKNTLNDTVTQPHFRTFVPREKTQIPYLETYADLALTMTDTSDRGVRQFRVDVNGLRRFDGPVGVPSDAHVALTTNRLGSVAELEPSDRSLEWLAADAQALLAFVPHDGIRPGDRWRKRLDVKIPPVQGVGLAPIREVELEFQYVGDERIKGRRCREIMAMAAIPLDELGLKAKDVLPPHLTRGLSEGRYQLRNGHGGRLLIKRQQWVDAQTSQVVKARTQQRYIVWMTDRENPAGPSNADIDNKNIVVASQDIRLELKD